jgi:hypothetical protein
MKARSRLLSLMPLMANNRITVKGNRKEPEQGLMIPLSSNQIKQWRLMERVEIRPTMITHNTSIM